MSVSRWVFMAVGVVAVVIALAIALGTAWLNTFIHSDAFRHEVETRAGQTLGGPVQIEAIDFDPFRGVKLRGLAAQIDSSHINGQGALVAKVESVNCTYALGDLLSRRLKLTGLTLDKPQIVLTRQAISSAAPPAATDSAETGQAPDQAKAAPFQFVLEGAKINGGTVSIRNGAGTILTDLNGIDADADTAGYYEGKEITGHLKIADVAFSPSVQVTDFSTPWIFDPHGNYLTAKPLGGSGFGGALAGDYTLDATGPSVLDVNGKGLDVGQVTRAFNPTSQVRLNGALDFQSKWRGVEIGPPNGEGDLQLTGGKLEGVRVLQELAGVLRVQELNAPNLRAVQTHFQVANGRTRFTGFQLDATAFRMTGDGVIVTGGGLDANMVLILSGDAMGRLPREAASFFVQQPDGSGTIGFHLGGSIDNPQTDLATRLLIQGATVKNAISSALNRFFHKHNKQASPPDQIPAPAPAPAGQ
jgi:uncharacterized protein involved in outer membrane biogenesis